MSRKLACETLAAISAGSSKRRVVIPMYFIQNGLKFLLKEPSLIFWV